MKLSKSSSRHFDDSVANVRVLRSDLLLHFFHCPSTVKKVE